MSRPLRSEQFRHDEIAIVHCVQCCVRRAFLTGVDEESGKDYSHRREWIRRRLESLASVLCVDILSYAILSNHLHVILRNRPDVLGHLTDREVAIRWLRVFPGRRIEEQLAEPSEIDVHANKPMAGTVSPPKLLRDTLANCGVVPEMFSDLVWNFKKHFCRCVGGTDAMTSDAERIGRRWHQGQRRAAAYFG